MPKIGLDSLVAVAIVCDLSHHAVVAGKIVQEEEGRLSVRKAIWAALCVGVALVSQARAQNPTSPGSKPRPVSFKPVSTTKNVAAPVAAQQSKGFSLTKFIPKLSLPSFSSSPNTGVPTMPKPGSLAQSKGPLQPMKPFTPK